MLSSLSNRYLKLFFIFSFSLMIFSLPLITLAQYQLLEPSLIDHYSQSLNLIDYLKLIYRTVLMVVVVISILMVAIGGVEYIFSQVPGAKTEGKQRITNAIIGLLIGLSSYLILYTIDPSFVKFNLTNLKPVHIDASGQLPGGGTRPGGGNGNGGGGNMNGPHKYPSGVGLTEEDARKQLKDANILVNGPPCRTQTYQDYGGGCTNLDGIPQDSINQLIDLKKACNCQVIVNGATEAGHAVGGVHAPGKSGIDLDRNTALDNYIINKGVFLGNQGNGDKYVIHGRFFEKEDSAHWHTF